MHAAIQLYDVALFAHILTVVLAFGPTFAYPVFLSVAERTDPRAIPVVARGAEAWDRIGMPMLIVLLASGIYMVIDRWSFNDFYVIWGLAVIVALAILGGAYFMPKSKQISELVERDIEASGDGEVTLSDEFQALNAKISKVGALAALTVVATIFVMVVKPF